MKKYFLIFATVLFAGLWSCEEEPVTPGVDEPTEPATATVGLKAAASTELTYDFVTAENNVWTVEVEATLGDGFDSDIEVSLEAAADATLADTYYTIAPATAKIAEGAATFTVTVNSAPADGSYTLPLTLVCETENVTVNPEANSVTLSLTVAAPKASLALTAPETYAKVDAGYSFTYTVATESEYIPEGAEYEIGVTVTDKNGTELSPGTDYTITGNATSFADGKPNEYVVTLPNPTAVDEKYTVKFSVETEDFTVAEGAGSLTLTFEPYPLWDKSGVTEADLDFNSWDNNTGCAPIKLFDNDYSTFWQNAGNNTAAPEGKEDYWKKGVPAFVGVNLNKKLKVHAVSIVARQDNCAFRARTGGFRFDDTVKKLDIPTSEISGGQWKWTLSTLESMFDVVWNTDYCILNGMGYADGKGGYKGDETYYREVRWAVLPEDKEIEYLQVWLISENWDYPSTGDGRWTGAAEIEVRLATPAMTVVE